MSDENDNIIVMPGLRLVEEEDAASESSEGLDEVESFSPPTPAFLVAALEAVLFAAGEPMNFDALQRSLGDIEAGALRGALSNLEQIYEHRGAGVRLHRVASGYQLRTVPRAAPYVARARGVKPVRLSRAAIETLAIVAYRQPVTRQEVEEIRGVDCGGVMRSLIERGLLRVNGRREDVPGRPLVYGSTPDFLSFFGLRDLSDLPTLQDLRELQSDDPSEGPVPVT